MFFSPVKFLLTAFSLLVVIFFHLFLMFGAYKSDKIPSPKPESQVLGTQLFFYADNIWEPNIEKIKESNMEKPQITANTALIVDLTTNEVLFEKNSQDKVPVASTVKILTAVVALEHLKPDRIISVSENAASVGEDFMGLTAGEKLTFEELLYGLLLPSGNDAAEAVAEAVSATSSQFVELMNTKAANLGAVNSKFVNPSGLQGDGEHYSTAVDLAIISKYAWENFSLFRKIVGTKYYEIPYTPGHKYFYLENQTNLLGTYPGVVGIKPGYTPEAGLCLVTLAENGGHQVLGIVLGATDRRGDMQKLLDYSFATLGVQI